MGRNDAILVIVDPSAKHHAGLAKGALLARKFDTRIEIFSCSGTSEVRPSSEILQALAWPLRDRGLEVTTESVQAESVSAALVSRLRNSLASLVIKDVHPSASHARAGLAHGDWELARDCPKALLLSKARLWPALPKICAAIEPQHASWARAPLAQAVMEQGTALSAHLGGELDVLHACGPMLTRVVSQLATAIVVVGVESGGPLRKDVMGSSAGSMLKELPCDVLLVKAPQAVLALH